MAGSRAVNELNFAEILTFFMVSDFDVTAIEECTYT